MDGFLEPFIEHHGLLRGLIEACIRNRDPEAYQRITEGVISFSRGWMALHNPENRRKVTGELSTMEFSIAMLASGDGPIRRSESIWGFPLILSSITLRISFAS